jgi:hypothetical protein
MFTKVRDGRSSSGKNIVGLCLSLKFRKSKEEHPVIGKEPGDIMTDVGDYPVLDLGISSFTNVIDCRLRKVSREFPNGEPSPAEWGHDVTIAIVALTIPAEYFVSVSDRMISYGDETPGWTMP